MLGVGKREGVGGRTGVEGGGGQLWRRGVEGAREGLLRGGEQREGLFVVRMTKLFKCLQPCGGDVSEALNRRIQTALVKARRLFSPPSPPLSPPAQSYDSPA